MSHIRWRELGGGSRKLVRLFEQRAGVDFVHLVIPRCRVYERYFVGIVRIVREEGEPFVKSKVSPETISSILDFLRQVTIQTDGKDVVVDEPKSGQQHADCNRVEKSELGS